MQTTSAPHFAAAWESEVAPYEQNAKKWQAARHVSLHLASRSEGIAFWSL